MERQEQSGHPHPGGYRGFPDGSVANDPPTSARDAGFDHRFDSWVRKIP